MNPVPDLAEIFPLMRGGGAFLAAIGLGILIGSFGARRFRTVALIAGAALGVALMAVLGATKLAFAGLPQPAIWQWIVLGAAFLIEGYLVSVVVRRFPDIESRQFWLWMLFIVGVHFLVLVPSHGPICGALALVCMGNALLGLRMTAVDFRLFWAVDGVLKIIAGVLMILVTL